MRFHRDNSFLISDVNIKKTSIEKIVKIKVLDFILHAFVRIYFSRMINIIDRLKQKQVSNSNNEILLVISTLSPGGAERQVAKTLVGLRNYNFYPQLLCRSLDGELQRFYLDYISKSNIRTNVLDFDNYTHDPKLLIAVYNVFNTNFYNRSVDIRAFMRAFLRDKPKLVHLWLDDNNIVGGIAALIVGVPKIVLGLRSMPPFHFSFYQHYYKSVYQYLASHPHVTFVNNSYVGAKAYEKWLGLSEGRIKVIHNGFDFESFHIDDPILVRQSFRQSHNIPQDVPLVGTIMRMSEEKRPLLFVEYAAELKKLVPNAHFMMVGKGVQYDDVVEKINSLGLADCFHLPGYIADSHIAMNAMDMYILTSRAEGLPNVLIEAQAQGVPAVTTNVGGAPETIKHGITGWVLEDDSPRKAAEKISILLQDNVWRKRAQKEAPVYVKEEFSMEKMIQRTLAVYYPEKDILQGEISNVSSIEA